MSTSEEKVRGIPLPILQPPHGVYSRYWCCDGVRARGVTPPGTPRWCVACPQALYENNVMAVVLLLWNIDFTSLLLHEPHRLCNPPLLLLELHLLLVELVQLGLYALYYCIVGNHICSHLCQLVGVSVDGGGEGGDAPLPSTYLR